MKIKVKLKKNNKVIRKIIFENVSYYKIDVRELNIFFGNQLVSFDIDIRKYESVEIRSIRL